MEYIPVQNGEVFQWSLSWEKHWRLSLSWWHGSSCFFLLSFLALRSRFIFLRSLRFNLFLKRAIFILAFRSWRAWRTRCFRACLICFNWYFLSKFVFVVLYISLQLNKNLFLIPITKNYFKMRQRVITILLRYLDDLLLWWQAQGILVASSVTLL